MGVCVCVCVNVCGRVCVCGRGLTCVMPSIPSSDGPTPSRNRCASFSSSCSSLCSSRALMAPVFKKMQIQMSPSPPKCSFKKLPRTSWQLPEGQVCQIHFDMGFAPSWAWWWMCFIMRDTSSSAVRRARSPSSSCSSDSPAMLSFLRVSTYSAASFMEAVLSWVTELTCTARGGVVGVGVGVGG